MLAYFENMWLPKGPLANPTLQAPPSHPLTLPHFPCVALPYQPHPLWPVFRGSVRAMSESLPCQPTCAVEKSGIALKIDETNKAATCLDHTHSSSEKYAFLKSMGPSSPQFLDESIHIESPIAFSPSYFLPSSILPFFHTFHTKLSFKTTFSIKTTQQWKQKGPSSLALACL